MEHFADRADHAGSVELWPLAPVPETAEPEPWTVPEENLGLTSAPQRLAECMADWIRDQTFGGVMLESRGRPLAPGDVMVLVRRRNDFANALVRALKSRGVAVAGLDRLVLTEQPAVQDLLALADVLLLPRDDLSLACVLTSPLGGLSDESLMDLAVQRTASLWDTLRARAAKRPDWQAAAGFLSALLSRVDYTTPHALLAEALGPLGGRARLYARLGSEAAEPVDELLNGALAYTRTHPPSLQGFLHWLRQSGAEVKREAEGAGGAVRVMTVHGAKGLQAPVVMLPDTTSLPPDDGPLLWSPDPATGVEVPLWSPRKEIRCQAAAQLRDGAAQRRMEEHNRLLYVALTRAEDRLVVCGWQTPKTAPETCWYNLIARGFARLETTSELFGQWGDLLRHGRRSQCGRRPRGCPTRKPLEPLPAWAGRAPDWRSAPPPPEPARPVPLAPSRPQDAAFGPVPGAASPSPPVRKRESASNAGGSSMACWSTCRPSRAAERAQSAPPMVGPPWSRFGRGHERKHRWRSAGDSRTPGSGPLVRTGQPCRGPRSPGLWVGSSSAVWWTGLPVLPRPGARRGLQDEPLTPRPTDAATPVLYLWQMAADRDVAGAHLS